MPRISHLQQKIRAAATDEIPAVDTENGGTKKLDVAMIMPTGAILDYAGPAAPEGWLLCFGQTLNATTSPQYVPLYQAIGNTYGGSSLNDFKLPDLRGRVVAGQDDMGGASANRLTNPASTIGGIDGDVLGAAGGEEAHAATTNQMPSHDHPSGWRPFMPSGTGSLALNDRGGDAVLVSDNAAHGGNGENVGDMRSLVGHEGGGAAANVVQPTIILNKIIKY